MVRTSLQLAGFYPLLDNQQGSSADLLRCIELFSRYWFTLIMVSCQLSWLVYDDD